MADMSLHAEPASTESSELLPREGGSDSIFDDRDPGLADEDTAIIPEVRLRAARVTQHFETKPRESFDRSMEAIIREVESRTDVVLDRLVSSFPGDVSLDTVLAEQMSEPMLREVSMFKTMLVGVVAYRFHGQALGYVHGSAPISIAPIRAEERLMEVARRAFESKGASLVNEARQSNRLWDRLTAADA